MNNFPTQTLYNLWCFLCLYTLGAYYTFVELNRKLQIWSKPRLLDFERDLPGDLSNIQCILTGGSRGIGLEVARVLLSKGAQLVIGTSKKDRKLQQLEQDLIKKIDLMKGKMEVWHLDLSSMDSVINFVEQYKKSGKALNLIINNAGIMFAPFQVTVDGFESHLATNYLGHALMMLKLIPLLHANTLQLGDFFLKSRVINVSSSTHFCRPLKLHDLNSMQLYSPFHAYSQSKLAQIMFSYSLERQKELKDYPNVVINNVHPGVVFTELYQYVGWVNWFPWLAKMIFRTPKEGAETVLFAAVSEEMKNRSFKYLEDSHICKSSKLSYNEFYQDVLYKRTVAMLKKWL